MAKTATIGLQPQQHVVLELKGRSEKEVVRTRDEVPSSGSGRSNDSPVTPTSIRHSAKGRVRFLKARGTKNVHCDFFVDVSTSAASALAEMPTRWYSLVEYRVFKHIAKKDAMTIYSAEASQSYIERFRRLNEACSTPSGFRSLRKEDTAALCNSGNRGLEHLIFLTRKNTKACIDAVLDEQKKVTLANVKGELQMVDLESALSLISRKHSNQARRLARVLGSGDEATAKNMDWALVTN